MGNEKKCNRLSNIWPYFLLALLTGAAVAGCQKGGADCFTSTGKIITEERILSSFDSIEMNDNVNLILTQDSVQKVEVEAGENIIGKISTEVIDRQLVIHNHNTCNWVRSYSKPLNVNVHLKNIWKIMYNSAGNLTTSNQLSPDSMKLEIWGGAGSVDMNVNTGWCYILMHLGSVDVTLHGHASITSMSQNDYGRINLGELATAYAFVTNTGSNDCYVRASTALDATIGNIGNIYYTGNPHTVNAHINGAGQVIPY
jgi:hypothetical protein